MANKTYVTFVDKQGGTTATDYIGNEGELFYDPSSLELRVSDGVTPGGEFVVSANTFSGNIVKDIDEDFTVDVSRTAGGGSNSTLTFTSSGQLKWRGIVVSDTWQVGTASFGPTTEIQFFGVSNNFISISGVSPTYDVKTWKFNLNGNLEFPISTVPASSVGAEGDTRGQVAFSNTHIYYCTADYNGGNIWVRVAWDDTGAW
jgi:hypothetical protein